MVAMSWRANLTIGGRTSTRVRARPPTVTLDPPLTRPPRSAASQALAQICNQLNDIETRCPATELVLHC